MKDEAVIKAEGVYKDFILPHERTGSVKGIFTSMFRKASVKKEVQHALHDISFEIKKGEFFGIVGRNGSGKSTLLKILAGIYQPTKGKVSTSGKLVPFIELGVGFNPELSGRDNVYLNGAILGFSKQEVADMYEEIVDFAELERFMDQKLKNYSTGMQVRLAFAMATKSRADILVVDEVLAVGDADFQKKCFTYFRTLKREKKTVVFVSHDMGAVREYCDRALLIEKSEVMFEGSADETAKEYTRLFLPHIYEQMQKEEKDKMYEKQKAQKLTKWGAGGVDIRNLQITKKHITEEDEFVEITYETVAIKDFEDEIIPGITIKSGSGDPVCGTNTKIIYPAKRFFIGGKHPKSLKSEWLIPNIFNEGDFTVEPAIVSASNNDTLLWWDDAAKFRVTNEQRTPYPVAPRIQYK